MSDSQNSWAAPPKRRLKAELKRADLGYGELIRRPTEMGWSETDGSVTVKANRGGIPSMVSIRHNASRWRTYVACGGLGLAIAIGIASASNPPAPGGGQHSGPNQEESSQNQYRAPTDYKSVNHPASYTNPVNGQVHTERAAEKQRTAFKESTPDWRNPEWAIVYATLALVLVSGVQIFMFYRQLRYMQTGMEDAKTAAEAAKSAATAATETLKARRAWITSVGYEVTDGFSGHLDDTPVYNGITIVPKWANSGGSPALNTEIYTKIIVAAVDETVPNFNIPRNKEKLSATVGPNQIITGNMRGINDADASDFRTRRKKIFFYSIVYYNDVFSIEKVRVSEVCFEITENGFSINKTTAERTMMTVGHPVGNQNTAS